MVRQADVETCRTHLTNARRRCATPSMSIVLPGLWVWLRRCRWYRPVEAAVAGSPIFVA